MPKKGLARYSFLISNIINYNEYLIDKIIRRKRSLVFTTKPNAIQFEVPRSLYQVFKEIFMVDVYTIKKLITSIPAKPVIIDIGANAGFFDVLILSKNKDAKIYAYEPISTNVNRLRKIVTDNKLEENVIVFQKAVTGLPMDGLDLFMEDTDDNQVVASIFDGFNKSNTKKIHIPSVTLKEIIDEINQHTIDLLKMDCEGSEYDIIYSTSSEYIRRIKHMEIEVHDVNDDKNNITYFNAFLLKLGYRTYFTPINDFCYALQATLDDQQP
jgi:FkbM family methyltransferase